VWEPLNEELSRWQDSGLTATLWWRDDDAVRVTPELEKLLTVAANTGTAPAIAVIPAVLKTNHMTPLNDTLFDCDGCAVFVHGFAHVNHASAGEKKCEFANQRSSDVMEDEIRRGVQILSAFDCFHAVFVPPWNRASDKLMDVLVEAGIRGFSGYGPRPAPMPKAGLKQVNTHMDIIDWKGSRGFAGTERVLTMMTRHLRQKRHGLADVQEPTGVLSHHLVHDDDCTSFLDEFITRTRNHPAVHWLTPEQAFQQ